MSKQQRPWWHDLGDYIWPESPRLRYARSIRAGGSMVQFLDCYAIRCYEDDSTDEDALTPIAAQNANPTMSGSTVYHIRLGVENSGTANANNIEPELQARINAGTWTVVTATDGNGSGLYITNGQPTDGAQLGTGSPLAGILTGFTGGYNFDTAFALYEEVGAYGAQTLSSGDYTEHQWAVQIESGVTLGTDTIDVRYSYDAGTAPDANTTITITTQAGPVQQTLTAITAGDTMQTLTNTRAVIQQLISPGLGPNLIANWEALPGEGGWTVNDWSLTDGVLRGSASTGEAINTASIADATTYVCRYSVTAYTSGIFAVEVGLSGFGTQGQDVTAAGDYEDVLTSDGVGTFRLDGRGASPFTGDVDNFMVATLGTYPTATPQTLTVTLDAGDTLTPTPVTAAYSVATPTVTPGPVTLSPTPVTAAYSVSTPSVDPGPVTLSPSAVAAAWGVTAPTVTPGAVDLTPDPASAAWGVFAPTLVPGPVTLTPSAATAAWGVFAPSVTNAVELAPDAVTAAWSIATPSVDPGPVTLTPDPASAAWATVAPTLQIGAVTLTPDAATGAWSVAAPTLQAGPVTLSPDAASAALSVAAPTLQAGPVTLTPTPATAAWSVATPSVASVTELTPTPVVGTWSVTAPTLQIGAVTLTPSAATAAWSVTAPSLVIGGVTLLPDPATGAWVVATPAVTEDADLTPTPITAALSVAGPTLQAGPVTLTPDAATAAWLSATPTVQPGAVSLTPDPTTGTWSIAAPTLQAGPVELTPSPASAAWSTFTPSVAPGAVLLVPDAATATWSVFTPADVGGDQEVTPDPAVATWAILAPSIEGGELTLTLHTRQRLPGITIPLYSRFNSMGGKK